ncbi:hypothetical protein SESBI_48862 [Sesbania bispinosa]|nr:hypothetical protein SESBI_48862 [Sesbania bispinosa]
MFGKTGGWYFSLAQGLSKSFNPSPMLSPPKMILSAGGGSKDGCDEEIETGIFFVIALDTERLTGNIHSIHPVSVQSDSNCKWNAPPIGRYKINTDAATAIDGTWGIGIVIRDDEDM